MNFLKKALIFLILSSITLPSLFAQGVNKKEGDIFEQSVDDLLLVGSTGFGGGIIGLSTLSFVDKPGDHLKHIVVGAALGIIAGVGWVAYNQAMMTSDHYGDFAVQSYRAKYPSYWSIHQAGRCDDCLELAFLKQITGNQTSFTG